MPTKDHRHGTKALVALFAAGLLFAACTSVNPKSAMTETDRQLMDRFAQQSLERDKVGQSRSWNNPYSGSVGSVMPVRTFIRKSGRPCRDYRQTVTAGGTTRLAFDTACRQSTGIWNSINFEGLAGYNGYRPVNPSVGHHHHRYPYHGLGSYQRNIIFGFGYRHRSSSFAIRFGRYFAG